MDLRLSRVAGTLKNTMRLKKKDAIKQTKSIKKLASAIYDSSLLLNL